MKTKNRILAALLTLAMVLTMLPISAFAENDLPATNTDVVVKAPAKNDSPATNTLDIMGIVEWDGDDNQQDKRPNKIMVHLLANNTKHTSQEVEVSANGLWSFSFDNLPAADTQGTIDYTITVDDIPGYTTKVEKVSDTHFVITNTLTDFFKWSGLQAMITGAESDPNQNSIKLQQSYVAGDSDEQLKINGNVTIDLNGYTIDDVAYKITVSSTALRSQDIPITSWEELQNAIDYGSASEDISLRLYADISCSPGQDRIRVDGKKTVTLDLAGHKLDRANTSVKNDGHVIEVFSGSKLTIKDGSGTTGKITGGWAVNGGGIYVNENASLTVESGTITGNHASGNGGGIYALGSLSMTGGAVERNEALESGGGVFADGQSSTSLRNVTITQNDAEGDGGGVYVRSGNAAEFNNCTITGNKAKKDGGGLYVNENASLTVEGGTITGNHASGNGGGIYALGSLTMTGGVVERNEALRSGGGIYADGQSSTSLAGVNITQNVAERDGGGIYINNGTLNLQLGAQITDNEAANSAGGIWLAPGKTLSVGGIPVVANNSAPRCSNVLICTYGVIKIESELDAAARIDVVMQKPDSPLTSNLTSSGSADVANSVFTYDKAADRLEVRDGELYLKQASVDVTVSDWQALQNAINDEANRGRVIGLGDDIIAGEEDDRLLLEGKSVTIDLNGHKIDRNLHAPDTDGHVFELRDYAGQHSTLRIIDSAGAGRITGGFAERGGAIYIHEGSTCNVEGSAITGNRSRGEGGVFFVGGTLNLTDVLVAQNASKSGGAICVYEQGEATLSDCVIRENRAEDDGGGIYIKEGTLNLQSGAVITKNEASNNGGGIYVADGAETVNIAGKVLIFNNRLDNDMYLTAGKKITVTGQLDNDTNIGVSLETLAGTFTTGFKTYNGGKAPDAFFKAASGYSIKKDEEGEARVVTSIAGATVTLTQPSFTYEGKAMKSSVIKSVELSGRILREGTDYTVSCTDIMNTGTVTVTVTGKGGFENMVRETFEITRRPLTVRADSATKVYDSTALVCEGFSGEGLADGDRIESAATAGSRTDAGSSPNEVSNAKVVNADGENVTDCYNITYINGVLAVTPAQAIITVDSASKVQGEADPTFTGEVEGLIADDDLGEITYRRISNDEAPGTYNGVLSAAYTDNPNYDVTVINGDFIVIPVSVTGIKLNSDNAKKVYTEGDALDVSGLTLTVGKSDGSKDTVDVTAVMVTGFDSSKLGKQTLTVTYEGFIDTYEVEVKAKTNPPTPTPTPTPTPIPTPTPTISYTAKDGSGNTIQSVTWQKGSGKNLDLTFKRSEDDHLTYGLFGSLKIGGVTVDSANYSAAEGSLKLSIKPEYLETLSVGDHTVKVNFQDGSATVKLTVIAKSQDNTGANSGTNSNTGNNTGNNTTRTTASAGKATTTAPKTCDESNLALWSSLMFLSVAGMLVVAVAAKRRRKER